MAVSETSCGVEAWPAKAAGAKVAAAIATSEAERIKRFICVSPKNNEGVSNSLLLQDDKHI